jgi:hypothetical protein
MSGKREPGRRREIWNICKWTMRLKDEMPHCAGSLGGGMVCLGGCSWHGEDMAKWIRSRVHYARRVRSGAKRFLVGPEFVTTLGGGVPEEGGLEESSSTGIGAGRSQTRWEGPWKPWEERPGKEHRRFDGKVCLRIKAKIRGPKQPKVPCVTGRSHACKRPGKRYR